MSEHEHSHLLKWEMILGNRILTFGCIPKKSMPDMPNYTMNVEMWVEQTSFLAGKINKNLAKELGMFSLTNSNTAAGHELSLEYLYLENFFFDGIWDLTIGKIDPLFLTTFALYTGWDKMTYFSKPGASDPVPPIDPGFGFFTEFNLSKHLSVGGLVIDGDPKSDFIDVINFFSNTSYVYQGFIHWAFPTSGNLYSYHIASYYYGEPTDTGGKSNGITYVANQGISEDIILTLKVFKGWGRTDAYDGAYAAGVVLLDPFSLKGDQIGAAPGIDNHLINKFN